MLETLRDTILHQTEPGLLGDGADSTDGSRKRPDDPKQHVLLKGKVRRGSRPEGTPAGPMSAAE